MPTHRYTTTKITDDIAALPLSRQRKYQLRNTRKGRCIICGSDAYLDTLFCYADNMKRGITIPGKYGARARKWL
jgi:hypothetical protein